MYKLDLIEKKIFKPSIYIIKNAFNWFMWVRMKVASPAEKITYPPLATSQ